MIYVLVFHKPTKRAFTLNRNYNVICPLILNAMVPENPVDTTDNWLSFDRPDWTEGIPQEDFIAYWLF